MPRIGCVSYLNAKPLIDGYEPARDVRYDVPAKLLAMLESGEVDVALCPVIDFYRSRVPLVVAPSGCIGCDGPTFTVRLFSRVPIERITAVHADTDSHTSVALLRVLLDAMYGLRPRLVDYERGVAPEAMLLIGDKVVTDSPRAIEYPHGLDLGEAWKRHTGMPFVFAAWLARESAELGDLPTRLRELRERNARRVDALAAEYAPKHAWPRDLALAYLGSILRYDIGPPQLAAIERFAGMAHALGLIDAVRPLRTVAV